MNHAILLPILIPLFLGCLLLVPMRLRAQRALLLVGTASLIPVALWLLNESASGALWSYALGNWPQPVGISLLLDRLSAAMLALVATLGFVCAIYATRGDDDIGKHFHPLFAFQLMGLNGAFLTADLFNLFVFFEILLIASYSLLLHGFGASRVQAGTHYVLLNLIGSSLFLMGIGLIYATAGTLSMADLSIKLAQATPDQQRLYSAGGVLILVVLGLKGALLPLYFWLPRAYASATASVAALFAIMTKVGIYSMLRLFTLVFGEESGPIHDVVMAWLWPLALLTIAAGAIGALAAGSLRRQIAYLVIVSAGTIQATVAMGSAEAISAGLFYLVHSTLSAAAFFLVADLISRERGEKRTRLVSGPPLRHTSLLGVLFFVSAISIAGLPPLSGFVTKVAILLSSSAGWERIGLWGVLLTSSLVAIIALSRSGTTLIWRVKEKSPTQLPLDRIRVACVCALLLCSPALVLAAQPMMDFFQATTTQLLDVAAYRQLVNIAGELP